MWNAATMSAGHEHVSQLDALLAHVWALVVRARELGQDNESVHLEPSIDLRRRVSPPLLEAFLGSPTLQVPVTVPAWQVASGDTAAIIRSTLASYDSLLLAAVLHEAAYLASP
jgi:hypothetical protein